MKNNEKLLYTIGEVKDRSVPNVPEKKPGMLWMKLSAVGCGVAAAALLGIVILGGGRGEQLPSGGEQSGLVTNYDPEQSTPDNSGNGETTTKPEPTVNWAEYPIYPEFNYQHEDKELVSFSANIGSGGGKGGGLEGVGAYNGVDGLREILKQNPWNESMEFETLPVFHNMAMDNWLGWSAAGAFMYLSEEQMNLMAENTAYLLGTEITSIDAQYDVYLEGLKEPPTPEQIEAAPNKIHTLTAQCADGTVINVDGAGQIIVDFNPSIPLPSEYSLDITGMKQGTADFLVEKFGNLLQFENPEFFTYNPDINNYVYAYDNSGSDIQKILNYNLYKARFYAYDNGNLSDIYIDNAFAAAKYMGDYPVITLDEAREMLLEGKFIANIWDGYIKNGVVSEEDIGGVELEYRYMGRNQENYQPYYCFYVELDREEEFAENYPGMTYYGSFYVPAVSEEYIGELTTWYTIEPTVSEPSEPVEDPNGANNKDDYPEDPYELIGGIEQIVKNSDTIEEMYQALNEFDMNGRIDKIVIFFGDELITATEGELKEGMTVTVYYDNEESWVIFKL